MSDIAKLKIRQENKNGLWKQPIISIFRRDIVLKKLSKMEKAEMLSLYVPKMSMYEYIKVLNDNNFAIYRDIYETSYINAVNDKIANKARIWARAVYKQKRDKITIDDICEYAKDKIC